MHPELQRCLTLIDDATAGLDDGERGHARRRPLVRRRNRRAPPLAGISGTAKGFERCLEKGAPLATATTLKQSLQRVRLAQPRLFSREAARRRSSIHPDGRAEYAGGARRGGCGATQLRLDDSAGKARQALGSGKMLDHPILGALTVRAVAQVPRGPHRAPARSKSGERRR